MSGAWMAYVGDVLSGKQVACRWARLACQRHVDDLAHGAARGLFFDEAAAQHAINFFAFLKHSKGEWAGRTLELEPWEQFIVAMVFGWKRADGTRRFRTSYTEVARKNGKSTLAAGIGLYMTIGDGEPGAEVYSAATKRDQARITHEEATRMVKASPSLRRRVKVYKDNLNSGNSKYEPLGADADTLDGLNVHCAIVDEVHAHKTRDVWDKLETATGARRQPLLFAITTAGFNRQSLCYSLHDYAEKVLDGMVADDAFFGVIYTLDPEDLKTEAGWLDESVWVKANPNLGVGKKLDVMREKALKAKEMPSALNAFLRLELDVWTQSETRWISPEHWAACGKAVVPEGLRGRKCYAGLDLSSNTDITALVLVFPPPSKEDDYAAVCRFFIPQDNVYERVHKDRVPYDAWVRQGFITATPGNVVDYDYILDQLDQDAQDFDIQEVPFDRWGATDVVNRLQKAGMTCVAFGQGFASMSPATKQLEKLLLGHKLAHGNNPVLTWMAGNLVVEQDAAGNIKPSKDKSIERIDGMVALIMALDRAFRNTKPAESVYKQRGLRTL